MFLLFRNIRACKQTPRCQCHANSSAISRPLRNCFQQINIRPRWVRILTKRGGEISWHFSFKHCFFYGFQPVVIRKSNSVCMVLVYLILLGKAENISLYLYSMFWSIAVSVYFADLAYNLLVMGGKWGYLILSTTKFLSLENELFPPPIGVCVCVCVCVGWKTGLNSLHLF